MRVLLTGANGYLGGWVATLLEGGGHDVLTFDSHLRDLSVSKGNACVPLGAALCWCDAVVHLGWYSTPNDDPIHSQCLANTKALMVGSNKQFIFASTAAVYGDCGNSLVDEWTRCRPTSLYGRCKLDAERMVVGNNVGGSCVLRFGTLGGIGAPSGRTRIEGCVNSFCLASHGISDVEVWDPDSYKPYISVLNAAQVVVAALSLKWLGIYNVSAGYETARKMALMMLELTGRGDRVGRVREVPNPAGRVNQSCKMDNSRLIRVLSKLRQGDHRIKFDGLDDMFHQLTGFREGVGSKTIP